MLVVYCIIILAHGGCASSTSGSKNLAVVSKRNDNSNFLLAHKNKSNAKVSLA